MTAATADRTVAPPRPRILDGEEKIIGKNQRTYAIIHSIHKSAGAMLEASSGAVERRRRSHDVGTLSIPLPHGKYTLIDEADCPLVKDLTLYCGLNGYVYVSRWAGGKSHPYLLHRYLTNAPKGSHVDHINGDKLDNRRSVNLRVTTPSINQVNRKRLNRNNTSGIRGVSYCPYLSPLHPWRAQLTINRQNLHLGLFATQEEAVQARREAEREHYGEECPCPGQDY